MKFIDRATEQSNRMGLKGIDQVVEFTISDARWYGAERLDFITAKIDKLVTIVAAMSKNLTDDQQKELVAEISYGWDVVE